VSGKTPSSTVILGILAAKGVRLLLCAQTAREAKRMTEATGFEAQDDPPAAGGRQKGGAASSAARKSGSTAGYMTVVEEASIEKSC